jgi:hypothetical protein
VVRRQSDLIFCSAIVLLIITVYLRSSGLAAQSLWNDDGFTVCFSQFSPKGIWSILQSDTSPPLYYILLHFLYPLRYSFTSALLHDCLQDTPEPDSGGSCDDVILSFFFSGLVCEGGAVLCVTRVYVYIAGKYLLRTALPGESQSDSLARSNAPPFLEPLRAQHGLVLSSRARGRIISSSRRLISLMPASAVR